MQKLLIVESEPEIQSLLKSRFATQFRVEVSTDPNAIRASSPGTNYDLIVWHIDGSKNVSGFGELIRDFPEHAPPVLLISDDEIPRRGPIDRQVYPLVWRPKDPNKLCEFVRSILNRGGVAEAEDSAKLRVPFEFEGILGTSLAMREIIKLILQAASVDVAVLITGETGTGKELVAAAIHKRSSRREFPYVAVNTGAMAPELITTELFGHEKGSYTGASGIHTGFFEQANRGTIFLDEISTMDDKTQVSLLRVLETKSFRRGEAKIFTSMSGWSQQQTRSSRKRSNRKNFARTCASGCEARCLLQIRREIKTLVSTHVLHSLLALSELVALKGSTQSLREDLKKTWLYSVC